MARDVPEDAYFLAWCSKCKAHTQFVDLMGDDQCLNCESFNTNTGAPEETP